VNAIVNKVLRERPEDPIEAIALQLQQVAPSTFPTFEKLSARRVYLNDNMVAQSIKLNVYLAYQGQVRLANTVTFAYDEEEKGHFLFNNAETKSGLSNACSMIGKEFTSVIKANMGNEGLTVENLMKVDAVMLNYFR